MASRSKRNSNEKIRKTRSSLSLRNFLNVGMVALVEIADARHPALSSVLFVNVCKYPSAIKLNAGLQLGKNQE